MEEIYIGKICNYFGLKGELKVISKFEMPEKAFKKGNTININGEEHIITGVRFHHNNYLIEIDNLNDINLITKYIGFDVYIKRDMLNLKDEYLLDDLIGFDVFNNDNLIGKVTDVINDKINPLIKANDKFFIPINGDFIIKKDFNNKIIYASKLEELDI